MTATTTPIGAAIGAPIGAKIGAPIGAKRCGDGRGAPIRRLKAAAISAQTPVQSRALVGALAQGSAQGSAQRSAQGSAQWRCERCSVPCPEPVVTTIPSNGDPNRYWCSLDHAAEDGWPWLTSEPAAAPARKPRSRKGGSA